MGYQPQLQQPAYPTEIDIPMAVQFTSRNGSVAVEKDSRLVNALVEMEGGEKWVMKRPGLDNYTTYNGGGAATSQGLWYHNGFLLAASGNNLTRVASPTSSGFTPGSAWSNTVNGPFPGRTSSETVVFNGAIVIIGGLNAALVALSDVWSSVDGQNWQQLVSGAPWGPRAGHKAVVFNNRLYILGGSNGLGAFFNDVWVTDDGVTWTLVTGAAGWSVRTTFGCVAYNNGIWVLGGNSGADLNDVWFSTDGTNWVQMVANAAWSARSLHGAVVFLNRIYVLGGTTNGRQVWYTSDGINWTQATAAAFSTARYGFGCCVYNGAIWAVGGFDGASLTQVWSSVDGAVWVQATAAYGGLANSSANLVAFQAPPGVSLINAPTLYFIAGNSSNIIWWANVAGNLSTTYVIPSPITAERMQACTVDVIKYLALKDTGGLYVWYANTVQRVTDSNYPPITVPGIVNLDETVYVGTPDGLICGSAIADPFTWPSRNFLGADFESDGLVVIGKYGNYVIALGNYTLQLFYNSGAPSATLLRPVKNANIHVGCAFPNTFVEFETTVMWVGRTESNQRAVYMMQGMNPIVISSPWVEAAINKPWVAGTENATATFAKIKGHPCYILSIPGLLYSFVFDFLSKEWYLWDRYLVGAWTTNFYATNGVDDFTMEDSTRRVLTWNTENFLDNGSAIISTILTKNVNNGTGRQKTCNRLTIEGDRVPSCSFIVSFSDDDYQTFSTPVTINMDQESPSDTRWGRYRQRAWKLLHILNTNFRVKLLQTDIRVGNS